MLYSISGLVRRRGQGFAVIETGGLGYRIIAPLGVLSRLPELGEQVTLLLHHHIREDANDLYGFITEEELALFESLISISGVGPKSAMGIMGIAPTNEIVAAINEGRIDLLTKASGVGKKTAERVVLELKGRLTFANTTNVIGKMEKDVELEETLLSLGYSRQQAKAAIGKLSPDITEFNERLKAILKDYRK